MLVLGVIHVSHKSLTSHSDLHGYFYFKCMQCITCSLWILDLHTDVACRLDRMQKLQLEICRLTGFWVYM